MVAARPATAGLGSKGETVASRFDKVRVALTALAPGVVLAAVGLPAVVPVAFAASGSTDLAANPGSLVRVPADDRPIFRWWWPTANVQPAEIRAELRAMKGAGFGGVEQSLLANDLEWGSPTFRERTRTAVRAASALGLEFDVTLGPGWPMSSPATEDLSKEISSQGLHFGAVELDGPETFRGPVPDSPPPVAGQPRRLIAVTAIRVTADGTPQTLDPTSAVDLTSTVRGDGTLSWSVPRGRWKVFGFWMRPSLMRAKNPGGGSQGWYVPDHFSARATGAVLGDYDRMLVGGDMAPLFRRNAGDVFEDSYEVEPGTAASGQSAVTLTPSGGYGAPTYGSPAADAMRRAVNRWIRRSRLPDTVVDFDAAVRDPAQPGRLRPAYDSGDHLHPNARGYRAMGRAVRLSALRGRMCA
jgi:hypothetical protein